ncbi:aminotransferase class V-fold PLP-dependent enzyme [Amycolatopsis aidingensis]|uniref:aminotransferase class V-fold PLP-dependent enzyme n=1 Tax=Amycolatopsis aidingensis TaxID=2842453 RepID=UPI001C0AF14F|nr:aminotransferase class V-fold PLP-dependent enzyme [Amycolatopsis aidingensis]
MTIRDVRPDFPVLAREMDGNKLTYLDSAATTLKPRQVIEATTRYYTEVSANIHRGKHMLSEEASDAYELCRTRVAAFLGIRAAEVVFTANTTQALNLVATGLDLDPGDLVLVSRDAHHSLQLPLRARATVDWIPTDVTGAVDLEAYARKLERRPALVAITHCSNVTGRYAPAAEMAALAREHGALTLLDAAQSVPHRPVRVPELGVDAIAFSAHKMLGPTGIGVLTVGPALADRLRPALLGGGVVDWVDTSGWVLRRPPHRFEAGTPHIAGAYGLRAAVDYLDDLGMPAVAEHDAWLAGVLHTEATKRDYLSVLAPGPGERSATLSVAVRDIPDLTEVARSLSDGYGVMCRSGHLCAQPLVAEAAGSAVLRLSAQVYNTAEDIRTAFTALDELQPLLAGA